ncbi:MAG TPA: hypothetical protein VIM41_03405 [Gammaproteobacteria bacterium]
MADLSVNLANNGYVGLQSIVLASFNKSYSVFEKETAGVNYKLVEEGGRLKEKL